MRDNRMEGCIHYGTQFERREEVKHEECQVRFSPLYMRLRRHRHMRRGLPF